MQITYFAIGAGAYMNKSFQQFTARTVLDISNHSPEELNRITEAIIQNTSFKIILNSAGDISYPKHATFLEQSE